MTSSSSTGHREHAGETDALIEFCRTGRLGRLAIGLNALQTEQYLGRGDVDRVHGEPNWQRHRYGYGSLSLLLMAPYWARAEYDEHELHLKSIRVRLCAPLELPEPIARSLFRDWTSTRTEDLLRLLQASGIAVSLEALFGGEPEDPDGGVQHFRVSGAPGASVRITALDGIVRSLEAFGSQQVLSLRHGRVSSTAGGRVAVTLVGNPQQDGQPVRVNLAVAPDEGPEREVTLRVGDRFRLGGQTWALTGVDNLGTYDCVVNLEHVTG